MRAMSKKTKGEDADGNHEAPVDLTAPLQVKMQFSQCFLEKHHTFTFK